MMPWVEYSSCGIMRWIAVNRDPVQMLQGSLMNGRVDAEPFWLIVGWNHQHDFFFLKAILLAWNLQSSISFVAIFCFSFPITGITGMYAKVLFFVFVNVVKSRNIKNLKCYGPRHFPQRILDLWKYRRQYFLSDYFIPSLRPRPT